MTQPAAGLSTGTYVLLSITLLLSLAMLRFVYVNVFEPGIRTLPAPEVEQPVQPVETGSAEPAEAINTESAPQPARPLETTLDEILEFEEAPTFNSQETEPVSELQQLLTHKEESHVHVGGKITLDDDASMKHPSIHDIEGAEVDVTIDFQ